MATNVKYNSRSDLALELTVGASKSAGDIVVLNDLNVFLLEDSDASNNATCIIPGVGLIVELTVAGADNSGNSAVAVGEKLYLDGTDYNKDSVDGTFIGYALGTVASGGSGAINVALVAGA